MADAPELLARKARACLRRAPAGVLSTASRAMPGFPFGSLAPFALTREARPVLFVSRLAEHSANLDADPRCCLTVLEPAPAAGVDGQALGRASLLAEARSARDDERDAAAARYFALFPEQRAYQDFGDFAFRVLEPVRVRWIGGFGEIAWVEPETWRLPTPEWSAGEASIVEHMNEDHAEALAEIAAAERTRSAAQALAGCAGGAEPPPAPGDVRMLACDPEGFHVRRGAEVAWIPFAQACATAEEVRKEMVRLVRAARGG